MLTQDVTKELETIFEQLSAQGKAPTIALVKARLSTTVPMPALITAIKSWKSANRVPKVEVAAEPQTQDKVTQLEQQVLELTKRVELLETLLNKDK